jgi:hypothetical protein
LYIFSSISLLLLGYECILFSYQITYYLLEITKSAWKKEAKEKLGKVVAEEVEKKKEQSKKMRFTRGHETQDYIKECSMEEVKKIMKIRLNMTELKANFKGKHQETTCSACKQEEETTEHVIKCEEYKRIVGHSIKVDCSVEECMQNLEWLREVGDVYERIEETKKWLSG